MIRELIYLFSINAILIGANTECIGQSRMRGRVFLPETQGVAVLSTYINATSNRLVAMGDYLESVARSRKIHLKADRIAMENSIQWVETYFEKKRLNKEYREADRIDYLESRTMRNQTLHQRVTTGDVSGTPSEALNYMLKVLIGDENAYASIFLNDEPRMTCDDLFLTPTDIANIKMSSGRGGYFQLSNPGLIKDNWPKCFDEAEFDQIKITYDQARKKASTEIDAGSLTSGTFKELTSILTELEESFEDYYQFSKRKDEFDLAALVEFKDNGRRFLLNQRIGALKARLSENPRAYPMQFQFDGDKLSDLLKYCASHQLKFSEPDEDGRDTYARLFSGLRTIYSEFIAQAPSF